MAIPVYLQQFKAAGVYRVLFDKSTILNQDTQILRLVVGYSEKGPFNIPILVKDPQEFKTLFGDVNKKLEKRGVYFHQLALQMLKTAPIICLNLKKFDGETVNGATINTDFNPKFEPIDKVTLKVEDIYDTTRFWELQADKLNNLRSVEGTELDQYINLAITNTKNTSVTYFIRKASGTKVSGYNITVNDWYSDEEMPEYLEGHEGNLISDFFAEIYVFKGKFTAKQVLASDTLKNYFMISNQKDENNEPILYLRDKIFDAFGDSVDVLDALYNDSTSNAIGHYIGALIPYFKNKQGLYQALDIVFNNDIDNHNMMMSFNIDLLDEANTANIDLSGKLNIETDTDTESTTALNIKNIYNGTAKTTVLGNLNAPVVADELGFIPSVVELVNDGEQFTVGTVDFASYNTKVSGSLYVNAITDDTVTLKQVGDKVKVSENNQITYNENDLTINVKFKDTVDENDKVIESAKDKVIAFAKKLGVKFKANSENEETPINYTGTYCSNPAFSVDNILEGPEQIITSILRIKFIDNEDNSYNYELNTDFDVKVNTMSVFNETTQEYKTLNGETAVYGSSVSFINFDSTRWTFDNSHTINGIPNATALICEDLYDSSLLTVLSNGDCLLADSTEKYFENVYVQQTGTQYDENGDFAFHYVLVTDKPLNYTASQDDTNVKLVRIDGAINKEIGTMTPIYVEGYTYKNDRPLGQGMYAKLKWQQFILSALTDYKGLRTGLLNKSDIDYRYVIDTFESYPDSSLKSILSYLCKEKQSALCISNFPAVQSFVKCPYTSFTDSNGIFNIEYVVNGFNKKKAASLKFSLPSDSEGASFIAFYSPLKFSDGFVDSIVPSAGLVSNLFVEKYKSRQPYYIVAGPNYGLISTSGLVGPDYRYSVNELQIIEPFGVNVMVYKPSFGTFINANQTAKQTPVSALSKVHVRELVIYIQDEIEKVLQSYQWEFNNQVTRNAILDKANTICALVAANGGLQAYKNIMDESNNPPEIIDNEMAVISTHIEPGMGCGKMVQELTLYRSGQMKASLQ